MSTQIGDMEEFLVGIFILMVNLLIISYFAPYLAAAMIQIPKIAKPVDWAFAGGKGLANMLIGINIK